MTPEDYEVWKEHPQTKQFHKFLMDYRKDIMEKWVNGAINEEFALAQRATAQFAYLLTNLADDAISIFYKDRKETSDVEED